MEQEELAKYLEAQSEEAEETEPLPRPPRYIGGKARNAAARMARRPCIRSKLHKRIRKEATV